MLFSSAIALAQKDLRGFFRDRGALLASLLVPIMLVTVFGAIMAYAFGGGSGGMPTVRLQVIDAAQTAESKAFVKSLKGVDMISVTELTLSDGAVATQVAERKVRDGDAHHVLVLPSDYVESLTETGLPKLQMFRDPGRAMEDRIVSIAVMQAAMTQSGGGIWTSAMSTMLREQGMAPDSVAQIEGWMSNISSSIGDFASADPLGQDDSAASSDRDDSVAEEAAAESAEGGNISSMDAIFDFFQSAVPVETTDIQPPGRKAQVTYQQAQSVAGMSVMMLLFALTGSAGLLLVEREDGTLRRLFALPIPRSSVLLGKFIFVIVIGIMQLAILFTYGELMFRVGMFRDPATLIVLAVTWVATGGAFGMFLASACKSAKQAEGLSTLLILLMAALGGCWFPLQLMKLPAWLDLLSKSTPTYWAMSGFQGMLWNQLSWTAPKMQFALACQWAWAIALGTLSIWLFKRNFARG